MEAQLEMQVELLRDKAHRLAQLPPKYCPFNMLHSQTPTFFFFFLLFLGPHMEIPRLGVQSELQLLPIPQQCRIQALSVTYSTAHSNTRSLTH